MKRTDNSIVSKEKMCLEIQKHKNALNILLYIIIIVNYLVLYDVFHCYSSFKDTESPWGNC